LSFAGGDHVTVDVATGHTHLSTSLNGLEKLHIDSVNLLAVGGEATIAAGLGEGASLNGLAQGAPSFTGGSVTLDIAASDAAALTAAGVNTLGDAQAFTAAGIDHITLDVNGATLESQIAAGTIDGINLGDLAAVSGNFQAGGMAHGLELQTGAGVAHISDTSAATLLADGLSFAGGDHVVMDAHGTHLANSLSDLQKLHVDAVSLAIGSDAANHGGIHLDLFSDANPGSMSSVLAGGLPDFTQAGNVTLDLLNTSDITSVGSNTLIGDLNLLNNSATVNNLVEHGIDQLAIHEALNVTTGNDWMQFDSLTTAHQLNAKLGFEINIAGGSNQSISLDSALDKEFVTTGHAPGNFDDLLKSLSDSGINDFVLEKGNVEITDGLASALVDSGMIHALPGANLILDAAGDVSTVVPGDTLSNIARLSTSLKSMADLGVEDVAAGSAHKVYVDLGLPSTDSNAMRDIHALLASLDPVNEAKAIAHDAGGNALGVSIVMSSDMMNTISSNGGFSVQDLQHLQHLGVTEIAVVGTSSISSSTNNVVNAGLVTSETEAAFVASQTNPAPSPLPVPVIVPDVKVIGTTDPLHPLLDPTHISHH
jgi:LysM repeat protein